MKFKGTRVSPSEVLWVSAFFFVNHKISFVFVAYFHFQKVNTCQKIRPISSMTVYPRRKYATQNSKPFFSSWKQRQHPCGILFCSWLSKTDVPIHWMEIRTETLTDGSGSQLRLFKAIPFDDTLRAS